MTTPQPSGADLARQALAAARAAAKDRPAAGTKKTRRSTRPARGEGRDPQAFGSLLERLTADHGWTDSLNGGNLIDQWATICPPELATTVQPTAYDPDRGLLTLQPSTPAYATQVRLFQRKLIQHLNQQLGKPAVREIRVLSPGRPRTTPGLEQPAQTAAQPQAPINTREAAHPGYRACLEAALGNKPAQPAANPYLEEVRQRQIAALRANRLPETEHREAVWAQADAEAHAGPEPGSMEASERAARAYARSERAGLTQPRRAFDAA
jgi:predicted nucleic acid-binding Zn ribbon protein